MDNQNQKYLIDPREKLDSNGITHSGEESGVRLDMSSWVGTVDIKVHRVTSVRFDVFVVDISYINL